MPFAAIDSNRFAGKAQARALPSLALTRCAPSPDAPAHPTRLMFGFFKRKQADEPDHGYLAVPDFSISTREFYAAIEEELQRRKVPGLEITRVDFAEGGLLSANREYLCMKREMLVFDICAAPFGTAFFFSWRFAEIPIPVRLWQILVLLLLIALIFGGLWSQFGLVIGPSILVAGLLLFCVLARQSVSIGLADLDATLIKTPVIGPIYMRWLRKETYYRLDTRLMYVETVSSVVRQIIDEFTSAKGVKLEQAREFSTLLERYKVVPWHIGFLGQRTRTDHQE